MRALALVAPPFFGKKRGGVVNAARADGPCAEGLASVKFSRFLQQDETELLSFCSVMIHCILRLIMKIEEARERFIPAVEEILDQCRLVDEFVDKEKFRMLIATIWGNAVLEPDRSGITEDDLPVLHDFLNEELDRVVGAQETLMSTFEFLVSKQGADSMSRLQTSQHHREFLFYFARLILQREVEPKA
jgi:hypothetical protein